MSQTALKFDSEVQVDGRVAVSVPLPPGSKVTVFIIGEADSFHDLVAASESSLNFWDNPYDDEDWNA